MKAIKLLRSSAEPMAYLALACVMAWAMSVVLRPTSPGSQSATVARSGADAIRLKNALGLVGDKATVIEFMDFQCPPCRATYPRLETILKEHPQASYQAVNFPLKMHVYAFGATVASEIAKANGQHDRVFQHMFTGNADLDPESLNNYLHGCNLPAIIGKATSAPFQRAVRDEMRLGQDLKVEGTPTLFVLKRDGSLTEVHGVDHIPDLLK